LDPFGWAFENGGNLQAQNSPPKFDFELIWCPNQACPKTSTTYRDIVYDIVADDSPHGATSLTASQKGQIRQSAKDALTQAYWPWKVNVGEGRLGSNTAYVVGEQLINCGYTTTGLNESKVIYDKIMTEAQHAVDQTDGSPTSTLLAAIGRGVGTIAAHEIAHQLVGQFSISGKIIQGMDLDDTSTNTYNEGPCDGSNQSWNYTGVGPDHTTPIHWSDHAATSLTNVIGLK
jgi:hypothetical protein